MEPARRFDFSYILHLTSYFLHFTSYIKVASPAAPRMAAMM